MRIYNYYYSSESKVIIIRIELYDFLDTLNSKNIKFALSNVIESNGKENYHERFGRRYLWDQRRYVQARRARCRPVQVADERT